MKPYRERVNEHFRRIRQTLILPYETVEMAKRLYEICERDDVIRCWMHGKRSRAIAAGIIYIASILSDGLPVSQREIAMALNICEPTVRKTYKKILELLGCYDITPHLTLEQKRRRIKEVLKIHTANS